MKKQKVMTAILKNADGTICEDISKKEWSPERRKMIAEKMGDILWARHQASLEEEDADTDREQEDQSNETKNDISRYK